MRADRLALAPKTAPDYYKSGGKWGEKEAKRCVAARPKRWQVFLALLVQKYLLR